MANQPSQPKDSSGTTCLVIAVVLIILAACACTTALIGGLVAMRTARTSFEFQEGIAPPDARVTLRVLDDGCTVQRGEVRGSDSLRNLRWVVTNREGTVLLRLNAENERLYRHGNPGEFLVRLQAWHQGAYWQVSDEVLIRCR